MRDGLAFDGRIRLPEANQVGKQGKGFYYTLELFNGARITVAALPFPIAVLMLVKVLLSVRFSST